LALAQAFQVAKSTLTQRLRTKVAHQLVEQRPNPDDGRSKCVLLTEKGYEFRDQSIAGLAPELLNISGQLSKEHVNKIGADLGEIRKIMDSDRD